MKNILVKVGDNKIIYIFLKIFDFIKYLYMYILNWYMYLICNQDFGWERIFSFNLFVFIFVYLFKKFLFNNYLVVFCYFWFLKMVVKIDEFNLF